MQKCIMLFYFYKRLTWWLFQLVTFLGKTFFVNPVPVALIEEGRSDSDDVGVGMSVADYVQPEVGSSGMDDVKAEVDTSDDENWCCLVPYNLLNPMRQREIKGNLPMNILHRLQEAALEEEENLQIVMVTGHNLSVTRTLKILA